MKIKKMSKFIFIAVTGVIVLIIVFSIKAFNFNDTEYTVTITDKDRITESSNDSDRNSETSSRYLVFADDKNGNSLVFENTDCFIRSKFNIGIRILSGLRNYKSIDSVK